MADDAKEPAAFDPKGKSFNQRVDAFIEDVKVSHKVIVTRDAGRTAEWQQKHHVAHMFLYNKYQSYTPANTEKGKRTISWDHFSDPKVTWAAISSSDFLRTKDGLAPKTDGTGWVKGSEPDRGKTEENVKGILTSGGIGNGGQAMVSSGLDPCGEPCRCGVGRSQHLQDSAADLKSTALVELEQALTKLDKEAATDIDSYLKKFGLYRPLVNHPTSPEKWHVEAIDVLKLETK